MKKSKLLLISLLTLTLVGCNGRDSSSTSEAPISNDSSTVSTTTSQEEESSVLSTTSTGGGEEASSVSSTSTYNPYIEGWGNDITDKMIKYLGGHVVPKFSIGNKPECYWDTTTSTDYGNLTLEGTVDFTSSTSTDVVTLFTSRNSEGWEVVSSSTTEVKVKNETYKIEGRIYKGSDDYVWAKFTYDEPYDSTAFTAWDSDSVTDMNDNLGITLPLFYLATAHPTGEWKATSSYSSDYNFEAIGGKWDNQINADCRTLIANDATWIEETTSSDDNLVFSYTDLTLGTITVKISKYQKGTGIYVAKLVATIKEAWNPNGFTAWPTDVSDAFNTYLDGHALPLIYLGTNNPTASWKSYSEYLQLDGGAWDDSNSLSTIKKAFEDDNTKTGTVTSPETLWDIVENSDSSTSYPLTATKTYSDGCKLVAKVYHSSYSSKTELDVYYFAKFDKPAGVTTWSTATITAFDTYLDNHADQIPFFWIGKDDPSVYNSTSSYYSTETYVYLYGSKWNEGIITEMSSALTPALGWSKIDKSDSHHSTSTYDYICYQKTLDDGCVLTIETEDQSNESYQSTMYVYFYIDETFDKDKDTNTDWDASILNDFTTYFSYTSTATDDTPSQTITYKIPYFYTGTKNPTGKHSSYSDYYEITGGKWDDRVVDYAKAAFEADTNFKWGLEEGTNSYGKMLTAISSITADNHYFKVIVKTDYYGKALIDIYYYKAYDITEYTGKWTTTTTDLLKNHFNNHIIPSFYMGVSSETSSYSSYYDYVSISGGIYDERIAENFKTALEADNTDDTENSTVTDCKWNITQTIYSGNKTYYAYKLFDDGTALRLRLQTTSGKVVLYCYYDLAVTSTATDWTEDEKTTIASAFGSGDVIPYFVYGSGNTTIKASTTSKSITITNSGTFSNMGLVSLRKALAADADSDGNSLWSFKTDDIFYNDYGYKIEGHKKVTGGSIYVSTYASSYSNSITFFFVPEYKKHADLEDGTTWNETITNKMTTIFGSVIVPYIYLGEDSSLTCSDLTTGLEIKGNCYSEDMFNDVKAVLVADGFECARYISGYGDKYLYGYKEIEVDGVTKFISVSLYGNISTYSTYSRLQIYIS